jgi:hypothetical protein
VLLLDRYGLLLLLLLLLLLQWLAGRQLAGLQCRLQLG